MLIRNSTPEDLPEIQKIYAYAREFMRASGNPTQWGNTSPELSLILGDFENKTGYVVEQDGAIAGVFAFIIGPDPTYGEIWDGPGWPNDEPYGTIHRIASGENGKGIFEAALAFCESRIANVRIDTHRDNAPMLHKIRKNGFRHCGTIRIADGTLRIAFQKTAGGDRPADPE